MIVNRHQVKDALGRMDWVMLAVTVALIVFGIFFIYSAVHHGGDLRRDLPVRQIRFAVVGMVALFAMTVVDYRRLYSHAWLLYALGLLLLVLVLVVGFRVRGASRWLTIAGTPVQPSELAKLSTITMLAAYLGRPGLQVRSLPVLVVALFIVAVPFTLIVTQPDLGTAMVLLPSMFVMLFLAGVPLRYLLALVMIGLALLPVGWFMLGDYQQERILVFLDPGRDPLGAGWNKIQSEIAVGSGGLLGKGFLGGTQNILGYLPRTVAPTDFIFSVIAEEAGFLGASGMLACFAVLLGRGVEVALVARDRFGQLLAAGLATMLFFHVFVNVAMTIGLVPITGLPLPLISYGGTFMVSMMLALGLMQSVFVRRYHY